MEVILAHGASGSAASMSQHIAGLLARSIPARAIDLPVRKAETAIGAYAAAAGPLAGRVIGGHSYGGRVASLLAASADAAGPAGLVLFSYPLHRPGVPDGEARSVHWRSLRCPVLFLSGESDPFARIDLLRETVAELLPGARLITWPRIGHSLVPVLDEALDGVEDFVRALDPDVGV